jgi:hypothetical protein
LFAGREIGHQQWGRRPNTFGEVDMYGDNQQHPEEHPDSPPQIQEYPFRHPSERPDQSPVEQPPTEPARYPDRSPEEEPWIDPKPKQRDWGKLGSERIKLLA